MVVSLPRMPPLMRLLLPCEVMPWVLLLCLTEKKNDEKLYYW